ncbi:hypothetical protein NDU88_001001 [Pleurodeles waltl]|uniref:Uncharacterized protein n=1 Tax=Pleurodeles waltl TaxID=8319 RepID=A0AAV7P5R1_PLEWA|nr:hypothetical protein NDU88_001001 [Pleurodeles waltl]
MAQQTVKALGEVGIASPGVKFARCTHAQPHEQARLIVQACPLLQATCLEARVNTTTSTPLSEFPLEDLT